MPDLKENLRRALEDEGLSMKDASLQAGLGETYVRDILERSNRPRLDAVVSLARVLRRSVSELIGEGSEEPVLIVGIAGAGPDDSILYAEGQGNYGEAPIPPNRTAATVAVEVRGHSMRGIAEDGWLIYYDKYEEPPTETLLGRLCVIGLTDGRVMIKTLLRGRKAKHFDLESAAARTLQDVRVAWAAPVTAIVPQRQRQSRPLVKRPRAAS